MAIGTDISPDLSSGNKQGTQKILDDRVNQDTLNYDAGGVSEPSAQILSDYLASPHNGRRLMPVPMVYPTANSGSPVVGYGLFLLISNSYSAGGTSDYYTKGDVV